MNKCHICGQEHEMIQTPFPFDGIHCPYSPRDGCIELEDGRRLPFGGVKLPPGWSIEKAIRDFLHRS